MPNKKKIVKKAKSKGSSNKGKQERSNFLSLEGSTSNTRIKIIGIGGGGCSIVSEISSDIKRVNFVVANTDNRALKQSSKKAKIFQFGEKITGGFGTGMNFEMGKAAALSEKEKIKKLLEGQDMCIFVSCLGGGTGSGAIPIFAKIAKDMGIITYGIFTFPFNFEGSRKMDIAIESLKNVRSYLNAITVLPNENIFKIIDKKTPLKEALSVINKNLLESLEGLIETIYGSGLINIDFADLRTILEEKGKLTYLNTAVFDVSKGVEDVIKRVVSSPFYSYGIEGAGGVLFNITGSGSLGLKDVSLISEGISKFTGRNSKVIFGISQDSRFGDKVKITLLAVGSESEKILPKKLSNKKKTIKEKESNKILESKKLSKNNDKKEEKILSVKKEKKENSIDSDAKIDVKVRRNALQVKKVIEEAEKEILDDENRWETPTFLRKNALNNDN